MGIYDRDYSQEHYDQYHGRPQMRMSFPPITPMVKKLLIINVAVFFIGIIFFQHEIGQVALLEKWFAVFPINLGYALQPWRLITYQFLHGNGWHIFGNMLGLYFLGPTLERSWGGKKFIKFYLGCGAAGGIFYTLLVAVGYLPALPMVGASGAILGMLAACAILFPQFVVFIFFFPVPIRIAAIGVTIFYLARLITRGDNAGGHAAHLAGMAAGALYVFYQPLRARMKLKLSAGRWEKKIRSRQEIQAELDRILEKVHTSGLGSLTSKEKTILRQATKEAQSQDRHY